MATAADYEKGLHEFRLKSLEAMDEAWRKRAQAERDPSEHWGLNRIHVSEFVAAIEAKDYVGFLSLIDDAGGLTLDEIRKVAEAWLGEPVTDEKMQDVVKNVLSREKIVSSQAN